MLLLPGEDFRLSVNRHNVDLGALVEWIEGSVTFDAAPVTQTDVAMPFALLEREFRQEANDDLLALLLDRHRLAAPPAPIESPWPGEPLRTEINAWIQSL